MGAMPAAALAIRPASVHDARALHALIRGWERQLVVDAAQADAFLATIDARTLAAICVDEDFRVLVAEDAGGVVGVIALRHGSHVFHWFTRRGREGQGVGGALWRALLASIPDEVRRAGLTVNASPGAHAIYRHLGFVDTGPREERDGVAWIPMRRVEASA